MPAYNAAKTFEATARELPELVDDRILVDDCSADDTASIARRLVLTIAVHERNCFGLRLWILVHRRTRGG